jgi:hypothetical protein
LGIFSRKQSEEGADNQSIRYPFFAEAPLSMLIPAVVLALSILLIGIFNQAILQEMIRLAVPAGV